MTALIGSTALSSFEMLLCLIALFLIVKPGNGLQHGYLCVFLVTHVCAAALLVPLLFFGGHGLEPHLAYRVYFWAYWTDYAVEATASLLMIYSTFNLAMAPLEGIRNLGVLVFRWAACMSLVVVSGSVLMPHPNEEAFILKVITEIQRTGGVLTLCMLLFVCFAIRPLGLSYRSRIFGIILGLGVLTTAKLLVFGWIAQSKQLYSFAGIVDSAATCVALLIWIGYFVAPEASRRIVVMPTTSPFLRWNQISQALGDAPGFVAVGGIPPELFAPAELEVMRRASLKMLRQPTERTHHSQIA